MWLATHTDGSGVVGVDLSTQLNGTSVVFCSEVAKPAAFQVVPSSSGDPEQFNFHLRPRLEGRRERPALGTCHLDARMV